jgi:regulator of replication initiation timing
MFLSNFGFFTFIFLYLFFFCYFILFLSIYFMWGGIPTPHGPCSYCYSPYHHVRDCPTAEQFSNYSYEHMSTLFSRSRNNPYSDSYNLAWSNQSSISWQAQALENYAPQFHKLYHQAWHICSLLIKQLHSSSFRLNHDFQDQMLKLISNMDQTVNSLAQTVTSFNKTLNSHSQSIARIKVQFEQIANQIEEEELQS